jgi:dienelactone hydrolase
MRPYPHISVIASRPSERNRWPVLFLAITCAVGASGSDVSGVSPPAAEETTTARPTAAAVSSTTTARRTATAVADGTVDATAVATTADVASADCRPVTYSSSGRDLPAERCDPTGATASGPLPAAVILGGCADYEGDPLTLERGLAVSLAGAGVIALIVDYHAAAPPTHPETYCEPSPETFAAVPGMLSAVTDATAWLRTDPAVDGAAIGAVGYSLGGLWAAYAHLGDVDLASVRPASFSAIAMFASSMFPDALDAARAGHMPPLYLIHGELDDIVSVDDSTQLAQAAQAGGTEATLVIVPAIDHGWSEPHANAERDVAIADVTEFMTTHLGQTG